MKTFLFTLLLLLPLPGQIPSPLGEQRTLVYAINGVDPNTAYTNFFGTASTSLDSFYRAASYGQTWFVGNVISVSINMPSTCDIPLFYQRADAAAVLQGVNFELYNRRAYLGPFPCSWAGLGVIGWAGQTTGGKTYGMVFLRNGGAWQHEMGHSLGMAHASGYPYSSATEYMDGTDVMGGGGLALPNAPHRVELGWLDAVDVTSGGTFTLLPLSQPVGTRILRIQKPNTNQFYYLSYRRPFGAYDNFYEPYATGINIHVWSPHDALTAFQETTQLIDTHPGGVIGYLDAALIDGQAFTENSIQITQLSHTSSSAIVTVTFGVQPPPPPNNGLAIGDRIFTLEKTKVALSPGGSKPVCMQSQFTNGTLQAKQVASGTNWWQVNFDTGCDGWVSERVLGK